MTNRKNAKRIVEHDSFIGKNKKKENSPIIGVLGLGYVGLPVAVGFAERYDVIGFDVNLSKIEELNGHIDHTGEDSKDEFKRVYIDFTSETYKLKKRNYIILSDLKPITLNTYAELAT